MSNPSYFVPNGVPRPSHIKSNGPIFVLEGMGPDGLTGAMYGRPYDKSEEYVKTSAGWYMCLANVHARDLVRVNVLPGFTVGSWVIPRLLAGDVATVGYFGPDGYAVPEMYRDILDRLRAELDSIPDIVCTAEQAKLAADIVALNYHISIVELGFWEVLIPRVVWIILHAAIGVAPKVA